MGNSGDTLPQALEWQWIYINRLIIYMPEWQCESW